MVFRAAFPIFTPQLPAPDLRECHAPQLRTPAPRRRAARHGDQRDRRARVRAAFFAALDRSAGPFVRAASRSARDHAAFLRRADADLACRDSARFEAAECPSRFSALVVARERFADVLG